MANKNMTSEKRIHRCEHRVEASDESRVPFVPCGKVATYEVHAFGQAILACDGCADELVARAGDACDLEVL